MGTGAAVRRAERPVPAVAGQSALGNDRHRIGAQPPVHDIEMVGRLVHQKAAATRLEAVPAPEVVGAVMDVEIPVEIDRDDAADLAAEQQFLDLLCCGGYRMLNVTTIFRRFRFSASSTAWHCVSSITMGFSVITSIPRSSALTMKPLWK